MIRNVWRRLAAIAVLGCATPLLAQEASPQKPAKAGEGTLMVQDTNYPLTHVLAYQTTIDDEEVIAVVLSGQAVSGVKLKEVMDGEKEGQDYGFKRPYLKLAFTKEGKFRHWSAGAGNTSLGTRGGEAKGELKVESGRVSGKASQPNETKGTFRSGFDVHFDVALLGAGETVPEAKPADDKPVAAANIKPRVTGVFKGNGKEAKLAHFSAHWREPFGDEPSMVLVFTEKDHSKDKKPDFKASFGDFGSALIVSVHEGGGIFGCQVVHAAHEKQGFSSVGSIKTNNFKFADGKVEGELMTEGEVETFGETWEVKLKFVAPLGSTPAEFRPKDASKPATEKPAPAKPSTSKPAPGKPSKPREKPETEPDVAKLNVKDLALTKDATDFEYKKLVEHLDFKSKLDVKSVCAELAANLKAQGWTSSGGDLINANSSILKRERGEASLTIFVKPDKEGSLVRIFTEGLSWEEK